MSWFLKHQVSTVKYRKFRLKKLRRQWMLIFVRDYETGLLHKIIITNDTFYGVVSASPETARTRRKVYGVIQPDLERSGTYLESKARSKKPLLRREHTNNGKGMGGLLGSIIPDIGPLAHRAMLWVFNANTALASHFVQSYRRWYKTYISNRGQWSSVTSVGGESFIQQWATMHHRMVKRKNVQTS